MTGFERFMEIINEETEKEPENPIELENIKGNIEIENVSFTYEDDNEVIKNLSLSIEAGKTVALVGPSGGGKTTLCNMIPRFFDFDSGDIKIDGISIKDVSLKSLRENIGVVAQDVFLFTGTIKENITYGNIDATYEEIKKACINACAFDFINELDDKFDTVLGEKGFGLSEGQAQRISIARSFLRTRPILILDEATSALDAKTEISVLKSIKNLEHKPTCIIITHRPGALAICDRILRLEDGNLIEESKDFAFEVASDLV